MEKSLIPSLNIIFLYHMSASIFLIILLYINRKIIRTQTSNQNINKLTYYYSCL